MTTDVRPARLPVDEHPATPADATRRLSPVTTGPAPATLAALEGGPARPVTADRRQAQQRLGVPAKPMLTTTVLLVVIAASNLLRVAGWMGAAAAAGAIALVAAAAVRLRHRVARRRANGPLGGRAPSPVGSPPRRGLLAGLRRLTGRGAGPSAGEPATPGGAAPRPGLGLGSGPGKPSGIKPGGGLGGGAPGLMKRPGPGGGAGGSAGSPTPALAAGKRGHGGVLGRFGRRAPKPAGATSTEVAPAARPAARPASPPAGSTRPATLPPATKPPEKPTVTPAAVPRPRVTEQIHTPAKEGAPAMASRFAEYAAEMHAAAASREPQTMMEVKEDLEAIEGGLGDVAGALKAYTVKALDAWPVHPGVSNSIGTVHEIVLKAQAAAADIRTALRLLHENDLARHEAPRTGEHMWDVRAR